MRPLSLDKETTTLITLPLNKVSLWIISIDFPQSFFFNSYICFSKAIAETTSLLINAQKMLYIFRRVTVVFRESILAETFWILITSP